MEKNALRMILKELNIIHQQNNILKQNLQINIQCSFLYMAGWQSGHAAACKAVYSGSIPDSASIFNINKYLYIMTNL